MKAIGEVVCCCADFGSFLSLAERLAVDCAKVYYHAPIEREFRNAHDAIIGHGIADIHKIESFMHPDIVREVDLYVFPDIGYEGEQLYLRSIGKKVWGSNGADELERMRTKFVKAVKSLGLPMVHSQVCHGLTELYDYLKDTQNKWVKINEFRDNMETWHHQDILHSLPELCRLDGIFQGMREMPWFVVQDALDGATEIGYDGLSVDGYFPDSSYQGYEKKNKLYLGARTDYDDLPEEVRLVNEKFSEVLKEYQFRNFFATEIRNFEGKPYFIDPTLRMPGQTGEQLLETMANVSEVIWEGAHGDLIPPKWNADFAASATLNYKGSSESWKVVKMSEEARRWVKMCGYGLVDGAFQFPPKKRDDIGVVIGMGDTIEAAIEAVKENFEAIGDDSLSIEPEGFMDLLEDIHKAQAEGIQFTKDKVPEPESVL